MASRKNAMSDRKDPTYERYVASPRWRVGLRRSAPSGPTSPVNYRLLKTSLREKMQCRTVKARPTGGMSRPRDGVSVFAGRAFRSDIFGELSPLENVTSRKNEMSDRKGPTYERYVASPRWRVGLSRSAPSGPTSSVNYRLLKTSLREGMAVGP